jgi:Uma2 family endonuclease
MTAKLSKNKEILPVTIQLHPVMTLTDDQFFAVCQLNRDVQIERNATGELVLMSPTGSESDRRNFEIIVQLGIWTKQDGKGVGFGSSGGFTLPNGAVRSPDAAWINKTRWEKIDVELRKKFAPICPDFVVELRSETDSLQVLQEKMTEYIENGASLGWLIDPQQQKVYIYRPNTNVEEIDRPLSLNGEDILSGFVLNLQDLGFQKID